MAEAVDGSSALVLKEGRKLGPGSSDGRGVDKEWEGGREGGREGREGSSGEGEVINSHVSLQYLIR